MSSAFASPRTNAPTVSVVVPSYNHAPFVEACLRSIFHQTHAPRQLVVIDDGSTDNSVSIIERTLRDCPFLCELIARENRGLCRTLNEALARTASDYFAYLGSDDLWFADFLAQRIRALEARPRAVLAYGNAYHIDAADRIIDCTTEWAAYVDGDARRMLLATLAPLSPTVVYRRAALERYGWNEGARLEDYELYLRLSLDGEFAFDSHIRAAWRQHTYNTSRDPALMTREKLSAQRCVTTERGDEFGVDAVTLRRMHALANFRSAEEFMRAGEKLIALRLAATNLRGIPSANELARFTAGLMLPHTLLLRRKARAQHAATHRYGTLKEMMNAE